MATCQTLSQSIYHPSKEDTWTGVTWSKVEKTIETLQHRITKATERGEHRKRRDLQRLLNRSLSARLKAVRTVAQENSGKQTPGIDGEVWTTPDRKHQAALELRNRSKTKPLKRVYIPKSNGQQRPLRIPCMSDRARQALWNMALLPVVEATSDPHSYGFRPYGGCWDANAQIRTTLDKPNSPTWILDATIEKCFDSINHHWLLEHTPMETKVLKSWLKADYLEGDRLFHTDEGTHQGPQVGIICPSLANLTLNGLEEHIKKKFKPGYGLSKNGKRARKATRLNVVRYADDFIVTGQSKRQLERVKKAVSDFLAPRGLKINEEQTSIRHISEGFDFLGWTFRKYKTGVLLCKISKQSISRHRKEIKYLIRTTHEPHILIPRLNEKIRGWMNYHHCCNGIWKAWASMNSYLYARLMKWGLKRHSNKTTKWVFNNYWKHSDGRWTFHTPRTQEKSTTLLPYNHAQKKIRTRLSHKVNVFDLNNKDLICKKQLAKKVYLTYKKEIVMRKQKALCPVCNQYLNPYQPDILDLHHVIPRKNGGSDKLDNLKLLHEHCHYESHTNSIAS